MGGYKCSECDNVSYTDYWTVGFDPKHMARCVQCGNRWQVNGGD